MKKAVYFFSTALVMILSLNGCNKEIEDPTVNNSINPPFEIIANPVQTRTTNDGLDTKWAAGDAIAVFHAVAGTTNYVKDGEFTISEAGLASNRFSGEISETLAEDKNYDWYMIYPYASQYTTPANTSAGYTTVGSRSNASQTQTGNNSTAHLAGTDYPLLGKVSNVGNAAMPSVDVNQACSFIEFNVTNNSGADLVVSQISFTATEPIVGTYYINYADISNVVFTGSGNSYVSNVAKLTVEDGTAIANEGSAKFYIGIKPFSASSGTLKVAVNGYEKEITLSKATSFTAGKIKKVNFNYDKLAGKGYVELDWTSGEGLSSSEFAEIDGVTLNADAKDYAASNAPYLVKFSTSDHYAIIKTDSSIGQVIVKAKGFKAGSGDLSQVVISGSTDGATWSSVQSFNVEEAALMLTTTNSFEESYRYVKVGFVKSLNNLGIGSITINKPNNAPSIVASDISNVPATGVDDEVVEDAYELMNIAEDDVEVDKVTGCVTDAIVDAGSLVYSVSPNYDSDAATGTIVLRSPSQNVSTTITVSQLKSTLKVSSTSITIPAESNTSTFTVTSAEFDWKSSAVAAEGKSLTVDKSNGQASSSAQTITISSTTAAPTSGEPILLGTITVYRTADEADDPQIKTITVMKAVKTGESALYTANFNADGEHRPSSETNSFTNNEYVVSGKTWTLERADITTTGSPLEGAAHLIARNAKKSNTTTATAITENVLSTTKAVTKVSFLSNSPSTVTFTVQYSTDGRNWVSVTPAKDANVDANYGYSFTLQNVSTSCFMLKFSWSSNNTTNSNRDSKLDNVIVYGG